jgi:transcription elongation factor GreA
LQTQENFKNSIRKKMQKEPMTQFGYTKMTGELKHLKEVERPNIVQEIDTARGHGDLKENAEYHAAKEKQNFIETRIAELSDLVSRAQVVDPSILPHERVSFGSTVKIMDLDNESEQEYTIVGGTESNPEKGLISYHSPLAKQMIGKEEGDVFQAHLPSGIREFEMLEICFKKICFE